MVLDRTPTAPTAASAGAATPFDDTPEALDQLRTTVEDWLRQAKEGVETFYRKGEGTFLQHCRSTLESGNFNTTTTARAYMALAAADWRLAKGDPRLKQPEWIDWFKIFINSAPYLINNRSIKINLRRRLQAGGGASMAEDVALQNKAPRLNNFDAAHLADFIFAADYVKRFYPRASKFDTEHLVGRGKSPPEEILVAPGDSAQAPSSKDKEPADMDLDSWVGKVVDRIFESASGDEQAEGKLGSPVPLAPGQVWLDWEAKESRHFFVTLHSLRALAILRPDHNVKSPIIQRVVKECKQFCIEQCFYAQRGDRHEADTTRLVFACVIYSLYAEDPDKDLISACLNALALAQEENGSWPATHPIIREKERPWYITSHETALCLTWLYFQPRIPDTDRAVLLHMMERYFRNWVIKTFVHVSTFQGWFDDHTITREFTAGWVTAIVCHFLANYHAVLSNHLNRRVIESLNITESCKGYLIEREAHEQSARWSQRAANGNWRPTWPDLPPFAWVLLEPGGAAVDPEKQIRALERSIQWRWTDPELGTPDSTSYRMAKSFLGPILTNPCERPGRTSASGILPGRPGTRKTTLVGTIAKILRWPLVTVPGSVFFEKGFDFIESRANEVFRYLNYLSNCVIFFDEFEEFFRERFGAGENPIANARWKAFARFHQRGSRRRATDVPVHSRTIAAFITSSMLPRLQVLHDQERCLVFLATNSEDVIDRAIRRPGRFDYRIEIPLPKIGNIRNFLESPGRQTYDSLGFTADDATMELTKADEKDNYESIKKTVEEIIRDKFPNPYATLAFPNVEHALRIARRAQSDDRKIDDAVKNEISKALDRPVEQATETL